MLRHLVKTGLACALHWSGTSRVIGMLDGSRSEPLVLSYHRVVDDFPSHARTSIPAMLTSARMLERQLDWIGRRYRFATLDELAASFEEGTAFARPLAAVTFDDGYRDVYEHAFPLLKRKGIPAAIFVVTDLLGTSKLQFHDKLYLLLARAFASKRPSAEELAAYCRNLGLRPPDPERLGGGDFSRTVNSLLAALPQEEAQRLIAALEEETRVAPGVSAPLRALTWEMALEMHRAGFTIGSHTKTHAVLINESSEKVLEETEGSRMDLERRLGTEIRHFAYPDGRFNHATVKAVAASGYRFAYTTCRRRDPDQPLLTIPRRLLWEKSCVDPSGRFSPALLDCLITGLFDFGADRERDRVPPPFEPLKA